jgi:hypothetical protein
MSDLTLVLRGRRNQVVGLLGSIRRQHRIFGEQLFRRFAPGRVEGNAGDRAHLLALGLVKMAHALGAFIRIDLVILGPHRNGFVGALGFADIAIDAVVGNQ